MYSLLKIAVSRFLGKIIAIFFCPWTQTVDSDFADVVIQPDPNECDNALLISDSDDDESITDEDNDPDFPEPGRRTAQTNLTTHLTPKKWRYLAYKSFVNLISSQDLDRKVRYVLPSCVVSAIRDKFPNTDGSRYTGFISIGTDDGHILP